MKYIIGGIALLFFTSQAYAAVVNMSFTSTADNSQWSNPYVDNVSMGDTVLVTVAVDNGGSSMSSQTWQASDVVSVTFDFANGVHRTVFDPNGGNGLSNSTGSFVTDVAGNLIQVPSSWSDQDTDNVASTNSGQIPNAWFLSSSNDKYFTNAFTFAVGIPVSSDTIDPANWTASSIEEATSVPTLSTWSLLILSGILGLVGMRRRTCARMIPKLNKS